MSQSGAVPCSMLQIFCFYTFIYYYRIALLTYLAAFAPQVKQIIIGNPASVKDLVLLAQLP